ncbi:hypothetical protein VKT23_014722 [Stygiomarasmius scandens]|uniref:YDG domain-containing protein n=1 Tax=Marasmiellus scandens TaxID=2682957 RepID=A0ABR1J482_9AGAR
MVSGIYGHLEEFPVGSTFRTRKEMHQCGMHPTTQGGIAFPGGNFERACSIVIRPGQYCDDEDNGETITYTGAGGDPETGSGRLTQDQKWIWNGNKNLMKCHEMKKPVRVIRGSPPDRMRDTMANSHLYPKEGFRYDGLYHVTKVFTRTSKHSKHKICAFQLERVKNQPPPPWLPNEGEQENPIVIESDQEERDDSEEEVDLEVPATSSRKAPGPARAAMKRKRQESEEISSPTTSRIEAGPSFAGSRAVTQRSTLHRSNPHQPSGRDPHRDETSRQRQNRMAGNAKEKDKLRGVAFSKRT